MGLCVVCITTSKDLSICEAAVYTSSFLCLKPFQKIHLKIQNVPEEYTRDLCSVINLVANLSRNLKDGGERFSVHFIHYGGKSDF